MARPEDTRRWRVLRRLLPRWYRARWGDALLGVHRDRVGGARRARGLAFWGPLAWDVVLTALETRWAGPGGRGARGPEAGGREAGGRVEGTAVRGTGRAAATTTTVTTTTGGWDMHDLARDLRITLRTLGRSPGYLIPAVATLGLGIGVATTIFSLVNGTLVRPLPFPEAHEVVSIRDHYRSTSGSGSMSVPNYLDLRSSARSLEWFAAYTHNSLNLSADDTPERIAALTVTHDFLETLGVAPLLGRDFAADEDRVGRPPLAVIGYGLWRERFGGEGDVLGRTLLLNGEPHEIVGVLPRDFWFEGNPRLLVSFGWNVEEETRGGRWLNGVARLRDGATRESAQGELRAVFAELEEEYPEANGGWTVALQDLKERSVGQNRTAFYLLAAAALLVLLIGCVNVANLMLVRAERRRREMAVRAALGGGRGRIARVFLAEGLCVTLIAGALGVALAHAGIRVLLAVWGSGLPRADQIAIDGHAMGFALVMALGVGLGVGLAPSLRIDSRRLYSGLRAGGHGGTPVGSGPQRALVGVEVALAVVLVTGAGLLISSAREMGRIDAGVELEGTLVFSVELPATVYPEMDEVSRYFEDALTRIGRIPGVEAVGISPRTPLQGGYNVTTVTSPIDPALEASFVEIRAVTPGFFDAAGIPLLEGRGLDARDREAGSAGVLISDALARSLFPDRSAVGESIAPFGNDTPYRIVGVVGSVREFGLLRNERPAIYWAFGYPALGPGRDMTFVVRAGEEPLAVVPEIRGALGDLDPTIPLYAVRTLEDVATQTLGTRTLATRLFTAFASMALLLTAIGIFGVLAYVVEQRTREIGIRMAIGADRGEVVRSVVAQGLKLVGLGLAAGVGISLASSRFLEDLLYDVAPYDPWTLVTVVATVLVASGAASWLPARRAAGVAPSRALREE